MDELTLSYQPFNSGYECSFIKYAARSSKTFKIEFDRGLMVQAWVITWTIDEFEIFVVQSTHEVEKNAG
jgi:hypothetical protein